MKTLKKTLCLVLAVVMVVGVLILPAYAADNYDAAVTSLQNYGVLQGYPDGDLHTDASITRGQMAAIIYRIMTGDTESTDAQVADKFGSYADRYTDANVAPWAKGYIGFCTNAGVLKGYDTGAIQPNKLISGYEVMAMLLRALGYDHNNEYTGNNWQYNVLSDAAKTGINKNVTVDPAKATPRGAVAQYTYDAATQTNRVAPTLYPNVGYASIGEKLINVGTPTDDADEWGAPSEIYTLTYTWPDYDVVTNPSVADEPLLESWEPVTQAAVYAAAGLTGASDSLDTYLNGADNKGSETVTAASTALLGGQGRWTRVYADRIVYVDTFLSKVDSVTEEVKVNGKVAIAGSYDIDAYYNNFSVPATAPTTAYETLDDGSTGDADDDMLLGKTCSFAKGDVLASFGVSTETGGAAFSADDQLDSLVDAAKAATAKVTVNAIVKNAAGDEITGFVGTNGKTYLYNCTYAYNGGSTVDRLEETDIGETFTLYLDAKGNVLGVEPTATAADKGVGVVVDTGSYRIGAKQYAGELTVLKEDNTKATVRFLDASDSYNVYDNEDDAEAKAEDYLGDLISWAPETTSSVKGYSAITDATQATPTTITGSPDAEGSSDANLLEAGDADALGGTDKILNDNTVFFIANYKMQNSKGGYVFTGYSIVKGFQNIQDLSYSGTIVAEGNPYTTLTALNAEWIAASNVASYVLVVNATNKSTNTVEAVDNYAYLADPDAFVKVYDDYYQYDAIINGKAHQALKVNYDGESEIDETGLYTYSEQTNDGWKAVTLSENLIDGDNYSYAAGVITVSSATDNGVDPSDTPYLTVAKGASIYLVNPETGECTKVDATLGTVQKAYGEEDNKIWFQTDKYGWIDVIYVETPTAGATEGDTPESGSLSVAVTSVALNDTDDKKLDVSATITGGTAWETCTASVTAEIEIWTGTGYQKYATGSAEDVEVSTTGSITEITTDKPLGPGTYRITINVKGITENGSAKTASATTTFKVDEPSA